MNNMDTKLELCIEIILFIDKYKFSDSEYTVDNILIDEQCKTYTDKFKELNITPPELYDILLYIKANSIIKDSNIFSGRKTSPLSDNVAPLYSIMLLYSVTLCRESTIQVGGVYNFNSNSLYEFPVKVATTALHATTTVYNQTPQSNIKLYDDIAIFIKSHKDNTLTVNYVDYNAVLIYMSNGCYVIFNKNDFSSLRTTSYDGMMMELDRIIKQYTDKK